MGTQAKELGVDIFEGTPATDLIYTADGSVNGAITDNIAESK